MSQKTRSVKHGKNKHHDNHNADQKVSTGNNISQSTYQPTKLPFEKGNFVWRGVEITSISKSSNKPPQAELTDFELEETDRGNWVCKIDTRLDRGDWLPYGHYEAISNAFYDLSGKGHGHRKPSRGVVMFLDADLEDSYGAPATTTADNCTGFLITAVTERVVFATPVYLMPAHEYLDVRLALYEIFDSYASLERGDPEATKYLMELLESKSQLLFDAANDSKERHRASQRSRAAQQAAGK